MSMTDAMNVKNTADATIARNVRATERKGVACRAHRSFRWGMAALLGVGVTACSVVDNDQLPPDVTDPKITQTPNGARAAYTGVVARFGVVFSGYERLSFVPASALISDELQDQRRLVNEAIGLDQRNLPEGTATKADFTYADLQKTRAQAGQAIALLRDYLPEEPALAARLYALQGYTALFLAELFCSGVPLSTLDYSGDYTYKPGSTTEQVLTHAIALFDTALTLADDSTRFVDLARVGKGRALLALDSASAAAATVAMVPDNFRYNVQNSDAEFPQLTGSSRPYRSFFVHVNSTTNLPWSYTVPNQEGHNGLDWRTSSDPRTPITVDTVTGFLGDVVYSFPRDTAVRTKSLTLASGLEARLIEAEAALRAGSPTWLTMLNALRTDGTSETRTTTDPNDDPTATYTHWNAGSGGVDSLAPLGDPGTEAEQVDLLFRERGFWLFLTGHRQGDLRRLIRQYGRAANAVYPVGTYFGANFSFPYGGFVTAPIPPAESLNPLFTGCHDRDA